MKAGCAHYSITHPKSKTNHPEIWLRLTETNTIYIAMDRYYVNTQAEKNDVHEVHREGCDRMPDLTFAKYLGDYPHCHDAMEDARDYYPNANGCYYCSRECHNK